MLHTGDVTYFAFEYAHADTRFLSVYGQQMREVPYFATFGNHDLYSAAADRPYVDTFYLPPNSATGTEHYYSFNHGDVHFVSLDSIDGAQSASTNSPMLRWLQQDLASATQRWIIA